MDGRQSPEAKKKRRESQSDMTTASSRPPAVSDCESDSEGTSALALRRREASDDEDDDGGLVRRGRRGALDAQEEQQEIMSRHGISDDDEGAPPEEEEEEEEEEEANYGCASRSHMETSGRRRHIGEGDVEGAGDGTVVARKRLEQESVKLKHSGATSEGASTGGMTEQKKDAEPFAVPTAGAFYMHDDRFRDNGVPSSWRTAGGRRLWEIKDEKPWVHDRFQELNLNDENFYGKDSHGKRGRGRSWARGRGRGRGRVPRYFRGGDRGGGRYNGVENTVSSFSHQYGISSVRQGTRWSTVEEDTVKEITVCANKDKAQVSEETAPSTCSSLQQASAKLPETPSSLVAKPSSGSTLNYASPPFYPSGSFQYHLLIQTGKVSQVEDQQKGQGKDLHGDVMTMTSNVLGQGIRSSVSAVTAFHTIPIDAGPDKGQNIHRQHILKTSSTLMQQQLPSEANEMFHLNMEQTAPAGSFQRRNSEQLQPPSFNGLCMQQLPASEQGQSLREESQPSSENNSVSPGLVTDTANFPSSQPSLSKNIVSGRGGPLELGRGSSGYSSFMGLTSSLRCPPASTMVPVVQFRGQPQSGLGVPNAGVALPMHSGQPQFGVGDTEVTWVPILASGGSMGPTGYNSSYVTLNDPTQSFYYRQPRAQPARLNLPGQGPIAARLTGGIWKPPLKSELGNEDFGQRQSKPRRYSEMNFGH